MASRVTYTAVCLVCYTCELGRQLSKRDANRIACSHATTYQHDTTILEEAPSPSTPRRPSPNPT